MLTGGRAAEGTTCGATAYGPKPPVTLSPELTGASRAHAVRMGEEAFLAHTSPTGEGPGERATAAGYAWRGYGENIAGGYRTPAAVVEDERTSAGHCRNMMGSFVHLGVGHATVDGSPYGARLGPDVRRTTLNRPGTAPAAGAGAQTWPESCAMRASSAAR